MSDTESNTLIRSLPWQDRIAILSVLAVVTILSWWYLVDMALGMNSMMGNEGMEGMKSMGSGAMSMMQMPVWTASYFVSMLLMWVIMMVAMMVPTAVPMALVFAAISRKAASQGKTLAPTYTFVSGYVFVWSLFSLAATLAQWGLDRAALLSPMMVSNSPGLGAGLLIAAGAFQLTPMKDACLKHCRAPAHFISQSWKPGVWGAFRMGAHHGAYCLGCCWILMGLLFFGGVMSLLWIAGITLFVLLEKVLPFGLLGGRLAGGAMALTGVVMLVMWLYP